ncbi:hypothetical protein D3C84_898440 [compost metagenome]
MSPAAILAHYTERAARAWDRRSPAAVRYRGMGAAHALHAVGLLTDAEQAEALNRLMDACDLRARELSCDDSEGGVQ